MIAAVCNMCHVRIINNHDRSLYSGQNGYMYAIYIFTLMGEATLISNRYAIGSTILLIYIGGTSGIIYEYDRDLLRTYLVYMPTFILYITFVCYQIEKFSRISFL